MEPSGYIEPGYEGLGAAFERNFADHGDVGASLCMYHRGRRAVHLWGGHTDTGEPYTDDTLQLVFSTTKGAVAACVNMLMDDGVIDADAAVATYWPEFAANGKAEVTVRQLLSHQAGL